MIEIKKIETPYGTEILCKQCSCEVDWEECPDCEDGLSHHDCGEDTCCCLNPEPNVICDTCKGEGGYFRCYNCEKKKLNEVTVSIPPKDKSLGILDTIL